MHATWWQWVYSLFVLPGELFMPGLDPIWVSAAFWLLAVCAAYYAVGLMQDAVDPTYRQQRREARQARTRAQRLARERGKVNAASPLRIEPTLRQ
jgi:hypothetical protein